MNPAHARSTHFGQWRIRDDEWLGYGTNHSRLERRNTSYMLRELIDVGAYKAVIWRMKMGSKGEAKVNY
jgi:hypothetical protein